MLLPTYDCNFSCWYCLQKHEELHYSQEVIERIKKHINSYIKQNGITIFELAWFGGEPLLSINNILEIAKYSKELCQKNNTKYFNSITSNGFHFTDNIIDEFKALNFNSFQITIDGCKFDHDTVKFDRNSKSSAFEKTISNVKKLIRNIPDSRIMLRFNYSDKNIKPEDIINDLNKYLTIEERFRIEILFQKVWQVSVKDIIHSKIYLLKREFIRNGYKLANKEWLNSFGCYVERKHFNSILPNGNVVKCNNCELKTKLADINNDGVITFNVNSEYNLFNECFDCKHLPICFGCCPEHRLDYQIFKEKICNNNQYHIK